jgi:hypothetical protein
MSKETKPEMTAEKLVEKWGWPYAEEGWKMEDRTEELRADLRSVIRGELIRYDHYLTTGMRDYVFGTPRESDVDDFMNENWIE